MRSSGRAWAMGPSVGLSLLKAHLFNIFLGTPALWPAQQGWFLPSRTLCCPHCLVCSESHQPPVEAAGQSCRGLDCSLPCYASCSCWLQKDPVGMSQAHFPPSLPPTCLSWVNASAEPRAVTEDAPPQPAFCSSSHCGYSEQSLPIRPPESSTVCTN